MDHKKSTLRRAGGEKDKANIEETERKKGLD